MSEHPTLIAGQNYFVLNNSGMSYVGRLKMVVDPFEVALEDAAWIADTGRLHVFLREGRADNMEVEPVGYVPCARYQSIIEWKHGLFLDPVPA